MKIANIEAILWDGHRISETPEWISKALNQFEFDKPGYIIRENRPSGNIITVGTPSGEVIAFPNDYLICREDGTLDVWGEETLNKYKKANNIEC